MRLCPLCGKIAGIDETHISPFKGLLEVTLSVTQVAHWTVAPSLFFLTWCNTYTLQVYIQVVQFCPLGFCSCVHSSWTPHHPDFCFPGTTKKTVPIIALAVL